MKYFNYKTFVLFSAILLISCNKESDIPDGKTGESEIALEMFTHSTTVDQSMYINSVEHKDFLSPQILSAIESNAVFRQKMNKLPDDEPDTIFSYDEIPYIRETKTVTRIYADGEAEYIIDDLTPFSMNVLHQLSENPETEDSRISKTIIKDGFLLIYNAAGHEIVKEAYEVPDMKEFVDSVKYYLQMFEKGSTSAPAMLSGKMNFRRQAQGVNQKIEIMPDNNVRIEADFQPDLPPMKILSGANSQYRAVTELNPEMTRTLKFEMFLGNQLIQRKLYNYDESVNLKSYHLKRLISESPSTIESQTLTLNSQGLPVLKVVREVFYRNQMIFH